MAELGFTHWADDTNSIVKNLPMELLEFVLHTPQHCNWIEEWFKHCEKEYIERTLLVL
jgi:hypothetical protein